MTHRLPAVVLSAVVAASVLVNAWGEPTQLKPGERTPVFPVTALTGPFAGKTVAYVSTLQGAPTLIVFVHTDEAALTMLTKVNALVRRYADRGLKSFAVSLGGAAIAGKLKALAAKPKWVLPLTVSRAGLNSPACRRCRLDPKAQNTVLVSNKNQIVLAEKNLAPDDLSVVAHALEQVLAKK